MQDATSPREQETLVASAPPAPRTVADRLQEWFMELFGRLCNAGPELTADELRRLSPFEAHATTPFSHDNPKHQQALRDLWALFTGGKEVPDESLVFPEWKNFGFQQSDPGSDFRAAGVFGIHNLLFFAEAFPTDFARLAPDAENGFPFAIAGLNLTMMLLAMLDISGRKTCFQTTHAHNKRARKSFAAMLLRANEAGAESDIRSMERTFGYVYCVAFLELDRQWQRLKSPSMLAFNEELVKVKKRMDGLLIASRSVEELQRLAGV
eukprot:GGOE01057033.1.p2 GENE.GGOE01057033.1~~GGOE01057033.1.p2  ORF type:complete len:266 (+),score=76.91 GGOE01057033.1:168-965(+)